MAFGSSDKTGCGGCKEGMEAEIENKDPDDRTEEEQAILDNEDGFNDHVPSFLGFSAYGPLSSWSGAYCKFCFGVGILLSVVIAGLAGYGLYTYTAYSERLIMGGAGGFFLLQFYIVGKLGRYPLLGARFGPIVERLFGEMGIYLTAKAEKEYGGQDDQAPTETVATDGGATTSDVVVEDMDLEPNGDSTDLPEDYLKTTEAKFDELLDILEDRKGRIETLEEVLDTKDEKMGELKSRLDEIEKSKKEKEKETSKLKEEKIPELQSEIDRLKKLLEIEARGTGVRGPGGVDPGDTIKFDIPHPEKDVDVGDWYLVDIKWYDHPKFQKDQPVPVAVPSLKALGQLPDHIPENPGRGFIEKHSDLFPVDPEDYSQPIDAIHSGVADPGEISLFNGSFADADAVQEEALSQGVPFHSADLTLNLDLEGNVVQDRNESANVRRLRENNQRLRKQIQEHGREVDRKEDRIELIQHKLQTANSRINDLQNELEYSREDMRVAVEGMETMQKQAQIERKGREHAEEKSQRIKQQRDKAHQRARDEERKRFMDEGSMEEDRTYEQSTRSRRKKEIEAIDKIRPVWGNGQIDWDRLDDPDYEKDRSDVISEFTNDPTAPQGLQVEIEGMFEPDEV